ncbi:MAG: hypothetical protein L6290_00905, partial [Thermodesulfovibrionales bacterium]|nr:hypothetical protein [Thermodesulfovibrionales bacterium]
MLGILICIGLVFLGFFISNGIVKIKALERKVEVKGLSEREVPANIAIWPNELPRSRAARYQRCHSGLSGIFLCIPVLSYIIYAPEGFPTSGNDRIR